MSRRSRRRDAYDIANQRLPVSYKVPSVTSFNVDRRSTRLMEFEDRRQWHPQGVARPARSFTNPRHRLRVVGNVSRVAQKRSRPYAYPFGSAPEVSYGIGFVRPKGVLICVRRKVRREVMHAYGHAGKSGQKRPRWTEYSSIRCK